MFFIFPEDAHWNADRQAVEFGEYRGIVRVPRRVFQRLLPERLTPERCVEAFYLQRIRFESIAERKLRRRQLTEDGNVKISGRPALSRRWETGPPARERLKSTQSRPSSRIGLWLFLTHNERRAGRLMCMHALTTRLHTPPHAVLQIPSMNKQQPTDNEHRNCRAAVYAERNGPATALVQHDHGISDRNESGG